MTKRTKEGIIVVLMLLTICLYFISATYARYVSDINGNAEVDVATWNVNFENVDGSALEKDFNLVFTVNENENVVPGKIAPSTSATATIIADLTGTEVAVDYEATITETALETLFGASKDSVEITTSTKVGGNVDTTGTIPLINKSAFTEDNGKVEITITLTWSNSDTLNESDTEVGKNGGKLTLPVKLTLKQHIA